MKTKIDYNEKADLINRLKAETKMRKELERLLKESEANFRMISENADLGIYQVDRAGNFIFINPALGRLLGWEPEELTGKRFTIIIPEDRRKEALSIARQVIAGRRKSGEFEFQDRLGRRIPIRFHMGVLIRAGRILGFSAFIEDISDRMKFLNDLVKSKEELERIINERTHALSEINKRLMEEIKEHRKARKALEQSEHRYRMLFENAMDAICIVQDNRIKFVNPKAISMTGFSMEELTSMDFTVFIHPEDREMVKENYKKRLLGKDFNPTYSFRILTKNGKTKWVEISATLIEWEGRPATLNFLRDLTLIRKLEKSLMEAQKHQAIATLAGGIAHNFNNLLMSIQGNVSLMLLKTPTDHPFYQKLQRIEQIIAQGAELSNQLLVYAQEGHFTPKTTNLNRLLSMSSRFYAKTRKELSFQTDFEKDLWPVEADHAMLEQVLLNLFENARQAMPQGGRIDLQTRNIYLDAQSIDTFPENPGPYVRISIRDHGKGIPEDILKKIFEPFFSTREPGKGTGLGLAAVHGIIRNHNGHIAVESTPGKGSVFHIYLPAKPTASGTASTMQPSEEIELPHGDETVLIIDDEKEVLESSREMLEILGYKVLCASSGNEGIRLFEKNADEIKLILLDFIMPDMGGAAVFSAVKSIKPGVKVIFSSGYPKTSEGVAGLPQGVDVFIQKPFSIAKLSIAARKALNGS